jgi:hypothetical protein
MPSSGPRAAASARRASKPSQSISAVTFASVAGKSPES